jgi:hypothetical protein
MVDYWWRRCISIIIVVLEKLVALIKTLVVWVK